MQSRNPVFNKSKAFSRQGYATTADAPVLDAQQLQDMYSAPSATAAQTGRMTMDDVVMKTGLMFAVLLPAAALNYFVFQSALLTIGGALAGLVLGLVISFKQSTNAALILTYAGLEGLFVGGISQIFETQWSGIVAQAILGTLSVFGVALFAYKSGRVRVTPKFQRIALIAMGGYLVFSIVNIFVMMAGGGGQFGMRDANPVMAIGIGLFAITLAAVFLIMDFDFAEQGIKNGIPERYSWLAAFGLVVTLVWLYVEMLRLIAILRGSD